MNKNFNIDDGVPVLDHRREINALEDKYGKYEKYTKIHTIKDIYRDERERLKLFLETGPNVRFVEVHFENLRYSSVCGVRQPLNTIMWLGFEENDKTLDIIRNDNSKAFEWCNNYFATLLKEYDGWNVKITRIGEVDPSKYANPDNVSADIILWKVMSKDFYKDRGTQFFMLRNYANPYSTWLYIGKKSDLSFWTTCHFTNRLKGKAYDYSFAGEKFKISKGILFFRENVPHRLYKGKFKYVTELRAVRLVDFGYLGLVGKYTDVDNEAPFIPEEYWTEEEQ